MSCAQIQREMNSSTCVAVVIFPLKGVIQASSASSLVHRFVFPSYELEEVSFMALSSTVLKNAPSCCEFFFSNENCAVNSTTLWRGSIAKVNNKVSGAGGDQILETGQGRP